MKHSLFQTTLGSLALAAAACGGSSEKEADEYVTKCEEAGEGRAFASDESYRAFINAEAAGTVMRNDMRAVTVTLVQDNNRTISANIPPTFKLQVPKVAARGTGERRGAARPAPARRPGFWARVASGLNPIGTAYAHCPAFTGENYFFRLTNTKTPTRPAYEALLSVTEHIPNVDVWRKRMDGRIGQEVELTLMRATFSMGTITEGPFVPGLKQTFMVVP